MAKIWCFGPFWPQKRGTGAFNIIYCGLICETRFTLSQMPKSLREVLVCFRLFSERNGKWSIFGPFLPPNYYYFVAYINIITFITFLYHFHLLNTVWYPNEVIFSLFVTCKSYFYPKMFDPIFFLHKTR